MPNGISCVFFAGKNLIYGQKEKNVFKEGIGGIQTARTIDSAAKTGLIKVPHATGISKIANIAKKALYPLIILSGTYNTIKSDDKVKTGTTQASAIASMYLCEQVAEKGLNKIESELIKTNAVKNNKKLAVSLYIVKGLAYVAASIFGYNSGNSIGEKIVDKIRSKSANQSDEPKETPESEVIEESSDYIFEDFI